MVTEKALYARQIRSLRNRQTGDPMSISFKHQPFGRAEEIVLA